VISLDLISIHEVLSFRCDWRRHVTVDHITIRLLWSTREGIDWHWLLHHWLTWWCWWAGLSDQGLLLLEEVVEGG